MATLLMIISITVVFGSALILLWRIVQNSGINLKPIFGPSLTTDGYVYSPQRKECINIFLYTLLFRLFMLIIAFLIYCIFCDTGTKFHWNQIFDQWLKWDAHSYTKIPNGYDSYQENGDFVMLVFFPLYSWILKLVNIIIPNTNIAALTTSTLCYSFASVFMYKLFCIDYSRESAKKAVLLMSIFPFGFFYGAIMSESTFLLMSVLTLYFIRKHNWILAGIFGMCAALSRSVGVFLIFPATVELIEEYKVLGNLKNIKQTFSIILKKWCPLLLMPLGTFIYLFINYKVSGNAFDFLRIEEKYWQQVSQPFFENIKRIWEIINAGYAVSTLASAFIPGLIILLCMYAVMILGLRKHRTMYMTYMLIYLVVNTTMSWPLSLCRYLACTVPVYIILAEGCVKNKKLDTAITVGFSIMLGIYFAGYIAGKQIM